MNPTRGPTRGAAIEPDRAQYGFHELQLSEDTGHGMFLDDYHPWPAQHGLYELDHGSTNFDILCAESGLPSDLSVTRWNGDWPRRRSTRS